MTSFSRASKISSRLCFTGFFFLTFFLPLCLRGAQFFLHQQVLLPTKGDFQLPSSYVLIGVPAVAGRLKD